MLTFAATNINTHMSDYFDKITAADLNDEEVIVEDELSHNDKTFTEWFNRVTDATNEDGKPKWEMLFHITVNIRAITSSAIIGMGKVIQSYKRFKRNIELITDEEYEMILSIGDYLKQNNKYTKGLSKKVRNIIDESPVFDQLTDGPSQRIVIRNGDINELESRDIPLCFNISFVMNPPKTLNVRKMVMLFDTIHHYYLLVSKNIIQSTCRTAIYRKADTRNAKPWWITVDRLTGLTEVKNIGNIILSSRKTNSVPAVNINYIAHKYQRHIEGIFRHTSADNIWNNFIPAEAIIENYFDYMTSSTVRERWVKYNQWMY